MMTEIWMIRIVALVLGLGCFVFLAQTVSDVNTGRYGFAVLMFILALIYGWGALWAQSDAATRKQTLDDEQKPEDY